MDDEIRFLKIHLRNFSVILLWLDDGLCLVVEYSIAGIFYGVLVW